MPPMTSTYSRSRSRIARPVGGALVVHGETDQSVSAETAEQLASGITGAELVSVPGAAHVTPLEAPDVVNEALAGFFARVKR